MRFKVYVGNGKQVEVRGDPNYHGLYSILFNVLLNVSKKLSNMK